MSYGIDKYGELRYGEKNISDYHVELHAPDLMRFLPLYYQKSKLMLKLQNTISKELGRIAYDTEDVIKQFFVDTATWGLSLWEQMLDLETNLSLS